jgi:lysophospholipase L1-like esterase
MCYGDSLTWGSLPVESGIPTVRYSFCERWTGVLAGHLGDGYEILEEGLNGRTTNLDDPIDPRLNGARHLPTAVATHMPLDLVVIMLGTNDAKAYFERSPLGIVTGISELLGMVSVAGVGTVYPAPRVLLVAPPPLAPITNAWLAELFKGGREKSQALGKLYAELSAFLGIPFFDAGVVVSTGGSDGIHFSKENNATLGVALADIVRAVLEGTPSVEM